jgi:hypothetical protein
MAKHVSKILMSPQQYEIFTSTPLHRYNVSRKGIVVWQNTSARSSCPHSSMSYSLPLLCTGKELVGRG